MPKIRIDNREVEAEAGSTILAAARKLGLDIPALCYRDGCSPNTSCLACVVKVNGSARLVPSCATRVADGMVVESETPEVREARRMALELLLADHAGDCFAPCTNVCPAHMDIPQMIRQIQAGEFREALITVKDRIALPAVLGRICPELCEKGCRRAAMDSAISICRLKRFVADVDLASPAPYLPACAADTGKRVAIIGTGPAGLAAAWYLRQLGHTCQLFDQHPEPGGNLRYAVGQDKLPIDVLDAEIAVVRSLGVDFRMSVNVGKDASLTELRQQFDAVVVAVGEVDKAKAAALGLEMLGKGLKIDRDSLMTPVDGVFVAGAAIQPYKHAIRAVADGREAASIVDLYLRGVHVVSEPRFTVRLGVLTDEELEIFTEGAIDAERAPASPNGRGLSEPQAVGDALRCLNCDCGKLHGCSLRNCAVAYDANPTRYKVDRRSFERVVSHDAIVYESGKCISCGLCVQITEREREPLGLTYVGRGFNVRIGVPFDQGMSEALKRVGEECVRACPTGALAMRKR